MTRDRTTRRIAYLLDRLALFGIRQASAAMFGGYLLALILLTKLWYPFPELARYDFLFLAALGFQIFLLLARLESLREAAVVFAFHILATAMEVFKTSDAIRSWSYPGEAVLRIGNVPLFAGFMYSAVGSYLVRARRLTDLRYSHYPPRWAMLIVAALIYANFFSHHFLPDIRWPLVAATVVLYWPSWVFYRLGHQDRCMPTLASAWLVALFVWIAENVATYSRIWIYPEQESGWRMVGLSKLVAWFLLLVMSYALTTLTHPIRACDDDGQPTPGRE